MMTDVSDNTEQVVLRSAGGSDALRIAQLHAASWRRHYRPAYPDEFFGPGLDEDRAAVWMQRLSTPRGTATVVAEVRSDLVGFVHVVFSDDVVWGTLLDNLHVRHDVQRRGVGRLLVRRAAQLVEAQTDGGMYLWVLEPNVRAQEFYRAMGGTEADRRPASAPALPGVETLRYVWNAAQLHGMSA